MLVLFSTHLNIVINTEKDKFQSIHVDVSVCLDHSFHPSYLCHVRPIPILISHLYSLRTHVAFHPPPNCVYQTTRVTPKWVKWII